MSNETALLYYKGGLYCAVSVKLPKMSIRFIIVEYLGTLAKFVGEITKEARH
jgi:hypothetical protein